MDDLAPVGVRLLLSGIWELDASLLCVTVLFQLASMVIAIRVPAFVLTDKAKVLAFLLLCSYYTPRITHGVVPKMKATLQEFFGLEFFGLDIFWMVLNVDWMEKGLPILCYTMLKP